MNVGKVLDELVVRKGYETSFIFQGRSFTYRELAESTNRYANIFTNLGVRKGTKVAVYLPNIPEYVFAYLAIFKIGAVAVPLDHRLKAEEVLLLLQHCRAEILLTEETRDINLNMVGNQAPSIREIVLVEGTLPGYVSLQESLTTASTEFPVQEIADGDLAAIFYTSGTTGIPKGVMWTYRHLESPIATLRHYNYLRDDDVYVCAVPFSHNGGICGPLLVLQGIPMILMESFHPLELLRNLEKYQATFTFLVPPMFAGMVHLKEFETACLSSLKWIAIFGAPGGQELAGRFRQFCPNTRLVAGYGLTETAAPNVLMPMEKIKPGSVGKAVPWVEIRLVDEKNQDVAPGEVGEILIKGWPVTTGYYNQPDLTNQVIRDSWLYTGDLGRLDQEQYLYIVGRKKEVIFVGGLNVFPPEVEGVIARHPKVKEVAVVGISDPVRGEAVKAVIVPKEHMEITQGEMKSYCRQHLASYKVPSIIEFRSQLPGTGSGKIKKELLK